MTKKDNKNKQKETNKVDEVKVEANVETFEDVKAELEEKDYLKKALAILESKAEQKAELIAEMLEELDDKTKKYQQMLANNSNDEPEEEKKPKRKAISQPFYFSSQNQKDNINDYIESLDKSFSDFFLNLLENHYTYSQYLTEEQVAEKNGIYTGVLSRLEYYKTITALVNRQIKDKEKAIVDILTNAKTVSALNKKIKQLEKELAVEKDNNAKLKDLIITKLTEKED